MHRHEDQTCNGANCPSAKSSTELRQSLMLKSPPKFDKVENCSQQPQSSVNHQEVLIHRLSVADIFS